MQFFNDTPYPRPIENNNRKQIILLVGGTVFVALLTGIVSDFFGELPAFLSLSLLIFSAISLGNHRYGIFISIVLLPLSSTYLIPREMFGVTGLNPLNVTLLFSATSLILAWLVQPAKINIPKWPIHFWMYVGVFAAASLNGAIHVSSIPAYFKVLKVIDFDSIGGYLLNGFLKPMLIPATAFFLSVVVRNARRPSLCLFPLFLSAIVLPIAVIAVVVISGESLSNLSSSDSRGFLSVIGIHANELGLMFNMAFALAIFCFFNTSDALARWALGITAIILAVGIALTFSRGAYLGLLSVIAYLLLTQRRFRTTLAVLLLVAAAAFVMPDAVVERAATGLASKNVGDIGAGRVDWIWMPLLPEILSSPFLGHGLSSILWSEAAQRQEILPVGHPHSAYLGALLDLGILGTMIVLLFFRHMWKLFTMLARHASDPIWRGFFKGATACILLLLVQGLTDDSFMPSRTQPFLWLSYGLALGLAARSRAAGCAGSNWTQARDELN